MMSPNLFVVGAQKCGTTLLCRFLAGHDAVWHSRPKEPFTLLNTIDKEGFDAYKTSNWHSDDCHEEPIYVAEGSTTYLQSDRAADNIKAFCGENVRIIISIRQPVARAVSHYMHDRKRRPEKTPNSILDSAVYTQKSTYAPNIDRWQKKFDPDSVLVLCYDELASRPMDFLNRAADFLGIDKFEKSNVPRVNVGPQLMRRGDYLVDLKSGESLIPISDLKELQALLADDIKETEKLTSFDLSDWRNLPTWPSF